MHVHEFPENVLTRDGNCVNDIVIDPDGGYAYMSDVGTGPELHPGGIIGMKIDQNFRFCCMALCHMCVLFGNGFHPIRQLMKQGQLM